METDALAHLAQVIRTSSDPENPGPDEIRDIMTSVRRVAVIGMSRDPAKAARRVPSYLAANGFEILPINPFATRILGRSVFRTLDEIVDPVDMVLIFRPSAEAGRHVAAAAARPEKPVIWLQEGIRADAAASDARADGVQVVQDLCIFKVHRAVEARAARTKNA